MKVTAEVHFAQHLASNDTKIRIKTLKKVRRWISSRSACANAFTKDDMLKLWKGLFYCMWMCDKPLIQEKVADSISKLIHGFSRIEYSYMFISCFFETMSREWFGLDKYRLEKFMMFIRRFYRQSLEFLKKQKWDVDAVKQFLDILENTVLDAQTGHTYLSLKLHIVDIYLDELRRVGSEELSTEAGTLFLMPFCKILANSESEVLLSEIAKNVFQPIRYQDVDVNEENLSDSEGERKIWKQVLECEEQLPLIKFDCEEISTLLLNLGKVENIRRPNRKIIYELVKQFKDLAKGISPPITEIDATDINLDESESDETDIEEDLVDSARKRLEEEEMQYRKKKGKQKKNRKRNIEEDSETDSDDTNDQKFKKLKRIDKNKANKKKCLHKETNKTKKLKKQMVKNDHVTETNICEIEEISDNTDEFSESFINEPTIAKTKKKTKNKKKKLKHKNRDTFTSDVKNMNDQSPKYVNKSQLKKINSSPSTPPTPKVTTNSPQGGTVPTSKFSTSFKNINNSNKLKKIKKELRKNEETDSVFASFDRKAKTPPPTFLKKAVFKTRSCNTDIKKKNKKQINYDEESPKFGRKVNFSLTKNEVHDPKNYWNLVKKSPTTPYNSEKLPLHGVLKG